MKTRLMVLVAALLLVALGVGLGAGPLQGDSERAAEEAARQRDALAQRDRRIADLHREAEFGAAFAGATAAAAVRGRLDGKTVAILALPGADPATVTLLEGVLRASGARVTAKVSVTAALANPSGEGLLNALSSQVLEQTSGVTVPPGANAYQRTGALLARAIGVAGSTPASRASYDPTAISIMSSLKAAKLVDSIEVTARAGLTLVVLPAETPAAQVDGLIGVVGGYASEIPSVVTGPATAAADGAVLAVLRSQGLPVSTVDSLDTPMGRVVAVLALASRAKGVTGDYGVIGAVNDAIPPVS